ncbi:MAG: hypothetical protein QGD92_10530 [Gammaproteobacteria bacterium]|nr:hypothetical protein [Gammaproteobacteria bacterium]
MNTITLFRLAPAVFDEFWKTRNPKVLLATTISKEPFMATTN